MAEVLDQNEVDALLAAVDADESAAEASNEAKVFSTRRRPGDEDLEIRSYDFKRPERVSKDQMRALENLHEAFSRNFGAALSGFLRTIMEVKVANIEQMTFSEFTHSLPNPTCFNLLSCDPLEGNICFEISPLIIYPVIDRLLGGSNAELFIPQRPLTAIENRLVSQILARAMTALHEAWANIIEADFKLEETESNPALVQIVPPNEVVVVVGFELKMGSRAGTMSLCIPYAVIEPVVDKLSSQSWSSYKKLTRDDQLRERMAGSLDSAQVDVSAVMANTTMTLHDLVNLQVGDLILTDKPATSPLALTVEGKRKFIGQLGQHRGNRAYKVTRSIQPKDRV
ncbi:flagellar motor switch protein FliM [Algisphaera agarilytica]|uniref:Flagellar motor switch protein FliM n=1 Tax=Algisphaera agarilytica TaxID=1385975 RepID=A0A7X0LJ10_9BACT|nr:flagellar motor switch protein FliM [Algisphaera agarilytica]MBB6428357.1 flagellar motor switch protein FliM [Algisphaera agarilytica]